MFCCNTHFEYIVIKEHHDNTRYVEGREGGVYDEVAVVEQTEIWKSIWGVVEAQHDGAPYGSRYHPHQGDR